MILRSAVVCLSLLGLAGCDMEDFGPSERFHADFHFAFDLKAGGHLDVESFNGQIEIDGWDQNKVEITGTKFASTKDALDLIKIDTHATPDRVEVRTVRPSGQRGGMGARYTIHVPRKIDLERIISSNGQIRVQDVEGAARLKTSNGGVRATNMGGAVEAQTSNGPIDLTDVKGSVTVHTSNGRIHAENINGACEAETSNGGISVRLAGTSRSPMKFSTSNSPIDITLQSSPQGDLHATSSNGGITVHMPDGSSARLKADTSNSSITSDFDVTTRTADKHHLAGTIGSGGPLMELSSSNGSIRIAKGL